MALTSSSVWTKQMKWQVNEFHTTHDHMTSVFLMWQIIPQCNRCAKMLLKWLGRVSAIDCMQSEEWSGGLWALVWTDGLVWDREHGIVFTGCVPWWLFTGGVSGVWWELLGSGRITYLHVLRLFQTTFCFPCQWGWTCHSRGKLPQCIYTDIQEQQQLGIIIDWMTASSISMQSCNLQVNERPVSVLKPTESFPEHGFSASLQSAIDTRDMQSTMHKNTVFLCIAIDLEFSKGDISTRLQPSESNKRHIFHPSTSLLYRAT